MLNVKFEYQYQFFCFFNPFKDFFSSGQHRPLVFAYCLLVSDQTVKIKVFHISGPLLPLVLHLLQVEANIPNILVHTNSAEQRDDFLQTPNSQPKGGRTKCQPDKMPTGHNANQRLAFCPGFFQLLAFCPSQLFGWHFVRTISTCFGILSNQPLQM